MKPLSPYRAASEGFRLIWREPRAVFAWMALWFATFSAAAWAVAISPGPARFGGRGDSLGDIAARFGTFGGLVVMLFLAVWLVTAVAAFRAVLHPAERRWFYLRVGLDEARLGVLTFAAFLVAAALGGAPAYLVLVLASPLMHAVPALTRDIATGGALVTVWIDIWLGVRLSLIAVETFSERRFHLSAYWPVTGGRFWYLLACYLLFFLIFLGITGLSLGVGSVLYEIAVTQVGNGDLVRRGGLLLIAGALAVLTAGSWALSWTIFCACQAYAFRDIVGEGRDGVAPA
ncbi:MAG TPA: hypothetical protein VG166_11125 [Caulobacteraceae bacterium]|jgi:hypothetical protein|nr:hypothetical protein [Caulobacteraceae bacterium]